jgi:hypothetical protein
MCSRSSYSARINQLSLLTRDGLSHEGFISMVITVSCHLQMPTLGCQMRVPNQLPPYFVQPLPSWHLWYSYWLSRRVLWGKPKTLSVVLEHSRIFQRVGIAAELMAVQLMGLYELGLQVQARQVGVQVHYCFSLEKFAVSSVLFIGD